MLRYGEVLSLPVSLDDNIVRFVLDQHSKLRHTSQLSIVSDLGKFPGNGGKWTFSFYFFPLNNMFKADMITALIRLIKTIISKTIKIIFPG